jgi:signal transduction histidine kinase
MRLADFIGAEMEAILVQWEAFAATQLPASKDLDQPALRNHAKEILEAIARDISSGQSREEEIRKSKGLAPSIPDAPETAAETHALLRARSGFNINQMAAEYRALRSSVLRLWKEAGNGLSTDAADTIRFNEAVDQALCESIAFFSTEVDQSRNLFLGMLGHDMRNPLHAIRMTAEYLSGLNAGVEVSASARRLINSGTRMHDLLNDLTDFNRAKLGLGIEIHPAPLNLREAVAAETEQMRAAHPSRTLTLSTAGDELGRWDAPRIRQLLGNLIGNAVRYGSADTAVEVSLSGDAAGVRIEVRNQGAAISESTLAHMFDPLRRGSQHLGGDANDGSLGLGLFIAREIAQAHGGRIDATSGEAGTVFLVRLPR